MRTFRPLTLTAAALLLTCGLAAAQNEDKPERKRPERPEGAADRAEMLKRFDKDGDGKLCEKEREAAHEMRQKQMKQMQERRKQMLKEFDKDGDGQLCEKERATMQETLRKRHQQGDREAPEGRAVPAGRRGKEGKGGGEK